MHVHRSETVLLQPRQALLLLRAVQAGHGVVDGAGIFTHAEVRVGQQEAHVEGPFGLPQRAVGAPEGTGTREQAEEGQQRGGSHRCHPESDAFVKYAIGIL